MPSAYFLTDRHIIQIFSPPTLPCVMRLVVRSGDALLVVVKQAIDMELDLCTAEFILEDGFE